MGDCPVCKEGILEEGVMLEEGLEWPIHKCKSCRWWG